MKSQHNIIELVTRPGDTYLTGATSVGHEVSRPDQAADRRGVVLLDHAGELVVVATSPDERATPLDRVRIIDGFLEVEDVVQELVQVLRVAGTDVRVTNAALRNGLKVTVTYAHSCQLFIVDLTGGHIDDLLPDFIQPNFRNVQCYNVQCVVHFASRNGSLVPFKDCVR